MLSVKTIIKRIVVCLIFAVIIAAIAAFWPAKITADAVMLTPVGEQSAKVTVSTRFIYKLNGNLSGRVFQSKIRITAADGEIEYIIMGLPYTFPLPSSEKITYLDLIGYMEYSNSMERAVLFYDADMTNFVLIDDRGVVYSASDEFLQLVASAGDCGFSENYSPSSWSLLFP